MSKKVVKVNITSLVITANKERFKSKTAYMTYQILNAKNIGRTWKDLNSKS